MPKTQSAQDKQKAVAGAAFLPDFCRASAVVSVLVITELVAILITLAALDAGPVLWERFLLLSLYLQWIGMTSASGLCMVRRYVRGLTEPAVAGLCYLLLITITAIISEIAYRLALYQELFAVLNQSHLEFLIRNLGVCAVVSALALRYFWIQHHHQQETLALGNARFAALQSRIRPHFLFNTLNSIAELTNHQPAAAERAVEDLAALLRASLDEHDQPVKLRDELALSKAYGRIESQRLGTRLHIDWDIPAVLLDQRLPPLSLQPLLENAVRHGIEPLPDGGRITVTARPDGAQSYCITVRNPVGESPANPGSGQALENIRQRLNLLYGPQKARLELVQEAEHFQAELHLPLDKNGSPA